MSWWRLVNLEYIYQSRAIDGCFKTPARLAISFLTQLKVCVPKKPQIWGYSCHSRSSIIQLLLVGYFEPYLSQRHGSRHACVSTKGVFQFGGYTTAIYCKHVLSCRFVFKLWFVYSDLGGKMLKMKSQNHQFEYCMTCQMPFSFPCVTLRLLIDSTCCSPCVTGGWRGSKQIKQWNLANEPRHCGVGVEKIWIYLR